MEMISPLNRYLAIARGLIIATVILFFSSQVLAHSLIAEQQIAGLSGEAVVTINPASDAVYVIENDRILTLSRTSFDGLLEIDNAYLVGEGVFEDLVTIFYVDLAPAGDTLYLLGSDHANRLAVYHFTISSPKADLSFESKLLLDPNLAFFQLQGLELSQTGDYVFVLLSDGLLEFARDPESGALSPSQSIRGDNDSSFQALRQVTEFAESTRSSHLYLLQPGATSSVFVLERLPNSALQLVQTLSGGFQGPINGLVDAADFELANDDSQLLVLSGIGESLTSFDRNPDSGFLSFRESQFNGFLDSEPLRRPTSLAISNASNHVYVTNEGSSASLSVFDRDLVSGNLQVAGVVEVATDPSLPESRSRVAVSSLGDRVFVLDAGSGILTAFRTPDAIVFSSIAPQHRSVSINSVASHFLALINAGATDSEGCKIVIDEDIEVDFNYRLYDPVTKIVGVDVNPHFSISSEKTLFFAGFYQSEVPFDVSKIIPRTECNGTDVSAPISGVSDFQLMISSEATSDIIVSAQTPTGDGIVEITTGDTSPTGAFAIAAINIGSEEVVNVRAELSPEVVSSQPGSTIKLCETNSATGLCLDDPQSALVVTMSEDLVRSFSAFVTLPGLAVISNDPAVNRARVIFSSLDGRSIAQASVSITASLKFIPLN